MGFRRGQQGIAFPGPRGRGACWPSPPRPAWGSRTSSHISPAINRGT